MSKLVIVESPAKAKTIKKYLGGDYEVIASMGHVRDLPKARLCVDVKNDFKPKYAIIKGKEKLVSELKEAAEEADTVYLATDPDREGEAISWHLAYILGLDEDYHNRVTFNEITKTGITEGMAHPRSIDQNLVNAQQARRILDRLVGYSLSPFLAKTIRRGLSAGRVQSVALRIIVDREEEIRKFKPEEYWSIDARLTAEGSRSIFGASFYGDKNGEIKITNKEQSDKILADLESAAFMVESVKKGKKNKQPAPPFITSTLQQEASRKLGFQAKRTLRAWVPWVSSLICVPTLCAFPKTPCRRLCSSSASAGASSICLLSHAIIRRVPTHRTVTRPFAPPLSHSHRRTWNLPLQKTSTSFISSFGSALSRARWLTVF